jgi:hypothetical protein
VTCLDATDAFCSANDTNHAIFCAYHSSSSVYLRPHRSCTRIPDLVGVSGCDRS